MSIETTIESAAEKIHDVFLDAEAFFIGAAEYAAKNFNPQALQIVVDCVAAAEKITGSNGEKVPGDVKYDFAFSNIVSALKAVTELANFLYSDINFAIEAAVLQQKKNDAVRTPVPPVVVPEGA